LDTKVFINIIGESLKNTYFIKSSVRLKNCPKIKVHLFSNS
jgi:hypothetical protein